MPHLRSHTGPSPRNLPGRDDPPVDPGADALKKCAKAPCLSLQPVAVPQGHGNFQGGTPNSHHFLQLQRRGAAAQTLGSRIGPRALPRVSARGALTRGRPHSHPALPPPQRGVRAGAGGQILPPPTSAANASRRGFHPQHRTSFKVGLRAASRGSLRTRSPIQSWAPMGQSRQFLP